MRMADAERDNFVSAGDASVVAGSFAIALDRAAQAIRLLLRTENTKASMAWEAVPGERQYLRESPSLRCAGIASGLQLQCLDRCDVVSDKALGADVSRVRSNHIAAVVDAKS
jgi:hypothetical protein